MLTDCVKVPSRARLKDLGLEILGYDSAGEVGGGGWGYEVFGEFRV